MLKTPQELSEAELKEALEHCASEPIHIPGSIQEHGFLIAVDHASYVIRQVSENIERYTQFKPTQCLGRKLEAVIGTDLLNEIRPVIVDKELQPIQSARITLLERHYDVAAHLSGNSLIIEFEPVRPSAMASVTEFYDDTRNFAVGVHKAADLQALTHHVVASIRKITDFDRVMLYRFDEEWNGSVIAESRSERITSYLGMRFPASDIPVQARILYTKNYLRLIPDIHYVPVPITPVVAPGTSRPLDLSLAMLRSVSPVHIQYLENMRIRASMSVSIIQNGRLWGLVACHHNSPLYVPYQARMVAEIMGHIFSAQLSTMESQAQKEKENKQDFYLKRLSAVLATNSQIDTLMDDSYELALSAMKAEGMIVSSRGGVLRYGQVPDVAKVKHLLQWLGANQTQMVFETTDAEAMDITGGILSAALSQDKKNFIVWFRPPLIEEVNWAGNPEKPVEETRAGYRLTPRGSFELWKQNVRQRCEKWDAACIDTARHVVSIILESEKLSAQRDSLAKSEFLANMSHEIRTPMNAVIGLSGILAMSQPLTPKQKEFIRTLQTSADALLSLINDLLDIAKIEARTVELEEVAFDFTKLLQEVASMMAVRVKEKGLNFTCDAGQIKERIFLGDPSRIRQIILNLCSNAIKFTDKGSVALSVVGKKAATDGYETICMEIKDTGIGIPADKLDLIFHKFVQADSSINRKFGGTGLGLAITKTLTELMGGTLSVASEFGEGSAFTVCLPLKAATKETARPAPDAPGHFAEEAHAQKQRERILLVEDYAPNVMVATTYLEEFGYAVDVAGNGMEAYEMVKKGGYAVILMDVQMHGMNGFESTRLIREEERKTGLPPIPIVGMTAHALVGDRERCIAAGMDDYLSKPFNPATLQRILSRYTGQGQ